MSRQFDLIQSSRVDGALSNRNKIINGNFDIWQRGTSGASGYVADRWRTFIAGSTVAQSRQSFTLGQTDVPNEPTYFHRSVITSVAGSGNLVNFVHKLESVRTFANQTVTLSFWAKADASKNIASEFVQFFGTGGSPSSEVNTVGVTTHSLTTSWQKFTVTASIPSISGKTLGTDGNDQLIVIFWLDAGSNWDSRTNTLGQQSGTFDIAQVQLEAGDTATPFEMRPIGQELALCQRYYQKSYPTGSVFGDNENTGCFGFIPQNTADNVNVNFPVKMRASPTVRVIRKNGGAENMAQRADNTGNYIGVSVVFISDAAFDFVPDTADTRRYRLHYDVSAEL